MGYHIGLLIMAALHFIAPQFIEEGRLFWLRSPLHIVTSGKTESYYFTDEEFEAAKEAGKIKGEVIRNKGLGSLEPEQAHRSMFTPEFQRMEPLIPDPDSIILLEELMGRDIEPRRQFVNSIDFSKVRE